TLSRTKTGAAGALVLTDTDDQELMQIDMKEVFDQFDTSQSGNYKISKDFINADEATYTEENDQAVISLVAMFVAIEKSGSEPLYNGDFYVLVHIK
ncbi:MAG: hypothetical protein CVU92_08715, partial [Firmicutes bacterium HGW-Firmicutes-17]